MSVAVLFFPSFGAAGQVVTDLSNQQVSGSEVLIDRIIAVIGTEVLTESEFMTEARVSLIMEEGSNGVTIVNQGIPREILSKLLTYVIDQRVIAAHLNRLGGEPLPQETISLATQVFAQSFASRDGYLAFLRRFDVDEAHLREIIDHLINNRSYLARRMSSWRRGREGNKNTDTQKNIDLLRQKMARWLRELRSRISLQMLDSNGHLSPILPEKE